MKFSVVMISFNQGQYLEEAIRSVVSQGHSNVEFIVVDANSTDDSNQILEKYRSSIDCLIVESDYGPSDGLNKGFGRASGEILSFLNSDDAYAAGAIGFAAEYFEANPEIDILLGSGYFIDSASNILKPVISTKFLPSLYIYGGVTLFQQGAFFRREVFQRIGGFNINNKTCWDGELFLDMALEGGRFENVPEKLGYFRIHDGSITGSGNLIDLYAVDADRLFRRVKSRRRIFLLDYFLGFIVRAAKYVVNPKYLYYKYFDSRC